jgi:hypothetical protein
MTMNMAEMDEFRLELWNNARIVVEQRKDRDLDAKEKSSAHYHACH